MEIFDKQLTEAVGKAGSCPLLVNIIATRIRQLSRGAKPLLEKADGLSIMQIALREFVEGKIGFRKRAGD
ncbi:MAG: DNA-directed RNA polymerase subunit omega [Candidatus Aureabacteria bacterium]|nr:DNA-directed RNA polymerase subunit omega [Candidatus Auribacterota bacterium]